jgi:hypothetical protein
VAYQGQFGSALWFGQGIFTGEAVGCFNFNNGSFAK